MPSVGPNPFENMVDNSAVGSVAWSSPSSVDNSDNTRATASLVGIDVTHYLDCTNAAWEVPAGATIDGIEVSIERSVIAGAGEVRDSTVRLQRYGSAIGSNKGTATAWPTSDTVATYGGPTDLWGTVWDVGDINDTTFGVLISALEFLGEAMTARIDFVSVTVYYTAGAGSATAFLLVA